MGIGATRGRALGLFTFGLVLMWGYKQE